METIKRKYHRIGAVQLGYKVESQLLKGILSDEYEETCYVNDGHYSIEVKKKDGVHLSDKEWSNLYRKLKKQFGDNLMKVYSITSNGIHFVVYLRRTTKEISNRSVEGQLVRIIKSPDDPMCLRISAGGLHDKGYYINYRGNLKDIELALETILKAVKEKLSSNDKK